MAVILETIRKWLHPARPIAGPPYLVVGLGNPGQQYANNRHNVGYHCIDRLAQACGIEVRGQQSLARKRLKAAIGEGTIGSQRAILAKPLTFMNESGLAVAAVARWFKVPPERILVIHDDLDLPLGRVRLRPNGASGGHRGISSIIALLGTRDFSRVRIGIGRPQQGDPIDYVLADFDRDQAPIIGQTCDLVVEVVRCILEEGMPRAMNTYNGAGNGR